MSEPEPPGVGSGLPDPPEPRGSYRAVTLWKGLAYTAGMTPRRKGVLLFSGRVGAEVNLAEAKEATAVATTNAVAAVAAVAGGLDRIEQVVSMTVWISATADFTEHSRVADGGTDVLAQLVGGPPPARAAVGVSSLPGGSPVEVALVVAVLGEHEPTATGIDGEANPG